MSEIEIIPLAVDIQPFEFRSTLSNKLDEQDVFKFLALGFSHHFSIISQEKDITARWFYIRKCATEFWGVRRLEQALRDDLYHTEGSMPNNFALTIPDEKQRVVVMQRIVV